MMIRSLTILPSLSVNTKKWDHCIDKNENGLIYSSTVFLNTLAENWHGLVINDYEAVMPLPWKKKAGIYYYYMPPFIQQLGITGMIEADNLQQVITAVLAFAKYGDHHFNFSNRMVTDIVKVTQRTNLLIDLSQSYDQIRAGYTHDAVANIRKAAGTEPTCIELPPEQAIALYRSLYRKKIPSAKDIDHSRFSKLCTHLQANNQCIARAVVDTEGTLLCSGIFLTDEKRVYNVANAVTQQGRRKEANYFLFDRMLHEFSGRNLVFDFEGSDLPGVKPFYEKFGAINQPYFHYHHNRLPGLLRFLKR